MGNQFKAANNARKNLVQSGLVNKTWQKREKLLLFPFSARKSFPASRDAFILSTFMVKFCFFLTFSHQLKQTRQCFHWMKVQKGKRRNKNRKVNKLWSSGFSTAEISFVAAKMINSFRSRRKKVPVKVSVFGYGVRKFLRKLQVTNYQVITRTLLIGKTQTNFSYRQKKTFPHQSRKLHGKFSFPNEHS